MNATSRVLSITVATLVACGGGEPGDSTDAATDGAIDAGPDAAPGPGAIVRISADAYSVPAGTDVTVTWVSEGATACTVTTSTGGATTGTAGTLTVRVDELTRVIATCEPAGRASQAAIAMGRRCTGEFVADSLLIMGEQFFGIGDTVPPADACLVTTGNLGLSNAAPHLAARVTRVGGVFFDMKAGANGLDVVALESVGSLGLDWQNGHFVLPPLDDSYLAFPRLDAIADLGQPVVVASGRIDLRGLDRLGLIVTTYLGLGHLGPDVIELRDGTTLTEVSFSNTVATQAPLILGRPAGVTGHVTIRDNASLPHAEAMALVAALGPIGGTVLVCANLDDDPCP